MEELKFPKTINLDQIFDLSDTECRIISIPIDFKDGVAKLPLLQDAHLIKKIKLELPKTVSSISLTIDGSVVYNALPSEDNPKVYEFKISNTTGLVLNPNLFEIGFIIDDRISINAVLKGYTFKLEDKWADFVKYNQYYGLYSIGKDCLMGIYHCSYQNPSYNLRFIKEEDISEFMKAISLPYNWTVPVFHKYGSNEKVKMIKVDCPKNFVEVIQTDPLLKEYRKTSFQTQFEKASVGIAIQLDEDDDLITGHILAEYGLMSVTTVEEIAKKEIDYEKMKSVHSSNKWAANLMNSL